MNEYQTAAAELASVIAGFRVQEKRARQALIVAACQMSNLTRLVGLYRLAESIQGR